MAEIYDNPHLYDLEHSGSEPDISFFTALADRYRPARTLEIACGNGRVTLPLARAASRWRGEVVGLDSSSEMLAAAREKADAQTVEWLQADVRSWRAPSPFDLIISPCASLSHLLELDDQIAAWQSAFENLTVGGRFVVAELMADFPALSQSMQVPPRIAVELDSDHSAPDDQRLIRYKTTRYCANQQRATVHYLYDRLEGSSQTDGAQRFVSDYEGHVFYPNEMHLLFRLAGFKVTDVWGDYSGRPLSHSSRVLIMCGLKV